MYTSYLSHGSGPRRRFDEYYRCYPVAMLPGPERDNVNHGGKVIMPPSALDKLTRLEITYPMLFELVNGSKERMTHAGVLEFIAEEGKIYLPYWLMQTLLLEPGDLLQIKSTDLPSGTFVKFQPQSTSFLEITDPKAVLEQAMRNFSCLTKDDVFSFSYNDTVYAIAVLETRPAKAISVLETDLEVDFAAPLGYVEPTPASRTAGSGTSTPRSTGAGPLRPGTLHTAGSMAQAINFSSIAPPSSSSPHPLGQATSSNFLTTGHRLAPTKKSRSSTGTPKASTPVAGTSSNSASSVPVRRSNGPQPLRLPPGKLFFGYEVKPVKKKDETATDGASHEETTKVKFQGQGKTLRAATGGAGGTKRKGEASRRENADEVMRDSEDDGGKMASKKGTGQRLGGWGR